MKCKIMGCHKAAEVGGYCLRHYEGKWDYKHFNDSNDFILEDDVCRVVLRDIFGGIIAEASIDLNDLLEVKNHKWYLSSTGYVRTRQSFGKDKKVFLHNLIMNSPSPGKKVDHIDRDKLNNRRCNFRFATVSQNQANSYKQETFYDEKTSSRFKGVSWDKVNRKWLARIRKDYKMYYLGRFSSEIEAVQAYDKAAIEFFGEYAVTNVELGLL